MKINIDEELRMNRARSNADRGAPLTMFVVLASLAVFMGTTASTLAIRAMDNAIARYELNELNKKLAAEQLRMKAKRDEQNKINAARLKQHQLDEQKRQAGLRQAVETCNFWREQYKKENTSYNKLQRQQSCNFVNDFR